MSAEAKMILMRPNLPSPIDAYDISLEVVGKCVSIMKDNVEKEMSTRAESTKDAQKRII